MEENKKKAVNTATKGTKEPSLDELKNWCNQLLSQRNQLAERLNQITDVVSKLPWLFKVVENKDFFPQDFVQRCKDEIVFIMTPPPVEETDKAEKPTKE